MNWGKGIAIALASFIIFIGILVTKMIRTSSDLEEENYYQNEQIFAQEIRAQENAIRLGKQIQIDTDGEQVVITRKDKKPLKEVIIEFKRPNDSKKDKKISVENETFVKIDKNTFDKGVYQVKLKYTENELEIQQEQEIYI